MTINILKQVAIAKGYLKNVVLVSHHKVDSVMYFNLLTKQQVVLDKKVMKMIRLYRYQWNVNLIMYWEESSGKEKVEIFDLTADKPCHYKELSPKVVEFQNQHMKMMEDKFGMKPTGNALIISPVIPELSDKAIDEIIKTVEFIADSITQESSLGAVGAPAV